MICYELWVVQFFFFLSWQAVKPTYLSVLLFSQEVLTAFPCQFGMENMSGWDVCFYTGTAFASVTCSLAAYQRPKWADQCCHCKIHHCSVRCQYVTSHWKDISLSCQFFNVKIPVSYLWDHFLIEYSIFSITSPATSPPIELAVFLCHWVITKFMPW